MTVVPLKVVNNGDLARPVVFAAAFIFGTQERRSSISCTKLLG